MRIAVLYPRGQKTGGPEAMHQFVDELRRQGVAAFLCPHPTTESQERPDAFAHYDAPELRWRELQPDDLLVGAEIFVRELRTSPTRSRVMWWLSVDNAAPFRFTRMVLDRYRRHEALDDGVVRLVARLAREAWWRARLRRDRSIRHIAQSVYAQQFVERWTGAPTLLVSDFTVLAEPETRPQRVRTRVAFNPLKGGDLVDKVAVGLQDIEFVPLTGMGPGAVASTLQSAAVYLDLGHHPGKDRIPREAAMHGCAVLVARRGSGDFDEDVHLSDRFKVATADLVGDGRRALRETIASLTQSVEEQEPMRQRIRLERTVFAEQVQRFREEFERTR